MSKVSRVPGKEGGERQEVSEPGLNWASADHVPARPATLCWGSCRAAGCEQEGQEEARMGAEWGTEAWMGHSWQPGEVLAGSGTTGSWSEGVEGGADQGAELRSLAGPGE